MTKSKKISSKYIPEQLALGASIEMEKTDNPAEAMKIAMENLNKDAKYYSKLMDSEPKFAEGGSLGLAEFEPAMKENYINDKKQKFANGGNPELEEGYAAKMKKTLEPDSDLTEDDINKIAAFKRGEKQKILDKNIREANELKRRMAHEFTKGLEKDENGEYLEYAEGGTTGEVFKGDSFAGDKIDAKVNAGEMIINLEQQQRLLDLLQNKFADGGSVKWKYKKGDIPNMETALEEKAKLLKERSALEKAAAAGRNFKPQLAQKAAQLGLIDDIIAKGGQYAIPALMKAGILKVALGPEVSAASEALGSEDVGAGSDIVPENEPTFNEIEGVKEQVNKTELPNPYKAKLESKMADGGRVDEQVDSGKLKINKEQQSKLLEVLRGNLDVSELGNDSIIHAEEGAAVNIPSNENMTGLEDIYMPEANKTALPSALAVDYKEPIAPKTDTNALPYMPAGVPSTTLSAYPFNAESFNPIPGPVNPLQAPSIIQPVGSPLSVPVEPATPDVTQPTNAEVEIAAKPIREAKSKLAATKKVDDEWAANEQSIKDFTAKKLAEQDKKVSEIPAKDFWASGSTANKIASAIAISLGAVGASMTGGKNYALEIINKAMDDDFAKQKLSKEEELAKKEYALKVQRLKLEELAQRTTNKKTQMEIKKMTHDMQMAETAQQLQREKLAALKSGQQLDPSLLTDEERSLSIINPKTNKRYFVTAGTKETAQKIREYQNEIYPAVDSINRLREIGKEGKTLPFTERAAAYNTELQALIGNLRLPITGPGVLTDDERKMLKSVIGEPTAIFTLPDTEFAKLDQIESKLKRSMDVQYKTAGINMPKDTNEVRIQQLKKQFNLSESDAIKALKKTNKWEY